MTFSPSSCDSKEMQPQQPKADAKAFCTSTACIISSNPATNAGLYSVRVLDCGERMRRGEVKGTRAETCLRGGQGCGDRGWGQNGGWCWG